jgi:glycosyltransferase involved in cell wall biosynthesis
MNDEIICIMCVHNEKLNLIPCIKHLYKYVDKFVIYDDESTDGSTEEIKKFKKVVDVIDGKQKGKHKWRERYNRETVIRRAKELADTENPWVLCVDPDERFEKAFLRNLRKIIKENPNKSIQVHFRELWDNTNQYRSDGIWDQKSKILLFPLADQMTFNYEHEHHIPWVYRELGDFVKLDYNLYHLKMIKPQDREDRKNLYNRLDPNKEMQPIGYDYLVDETNIQITKIPFKKRYSLRTVPKYYK